MKPLIVALLLSATLFAMPSSQAAECTDAGAVLFCERTQGGGVGDQTCQENGSAWETTWTDAIIVGSVRASMITTESCTRDVGSSDCTRSSDAATTSALGIFIAGAGNWRQDCTYDEGTADSAECRTYVQTVGTGRTYIQNGDCIA